MSRECRAHISCDERERYAGLEEVKLGNDLGNLSCVHGLEKIARRGGSAGSLERGRVLFDLGDEVHISPRHRYE